MLKELRRGDWLEILGISEAMIPNALILRGTRNLQHHYRRYASHFSEVRELCSSTTFLEDVFIGRKGSHLIAYASVYGSSMASEVVHIFGELGTKFVIQTGCCGGLADDLAIGNLVVASRAFSGEGVAQYYSKEREFRGDPIPAKDVGGLVSSRLKSARLFTTAALLAEGRDDVAHWKHLGFDAVDMETAAVFSVAEVYGMRKSSLLFVSDLPGTENGLLHRSEDKGADLELIDNEMIALAIAVAAHRSYSLS